VRLSRRVFVVPKGTCTAAVVEELNDVHGMAVTEKSGLPLDPTGWNDEADFAMAINKAFRVKGGKAAPKFWKGVREAVMKLCATQDLLCMIGPPGPPEPAQLLLKNLFDAADTKAVADQLVGLRSGKVLAVLVGWDVEAVRAWPLIGDDPIAAPPSRNELSGRNDPDDLSQYYTQYSRQAPPRQVPPRQRQQFAQQGAMQGHGHGQRYGSGMAMGQFSHNYSLDPNGHSGYGMFNSYEGSYDGNVPSGAYAGSGYPEQQCADAFSYQHGGADVSYYAHAQTASQAACMSQRMLAGSAQGQQHLNGYGGAQQPMFDPQQGGYASSGGYNQHQQHLKQQHSNLQQSVASAVAGAGAGSSYNNHRQCNSFSDGGSAGNNGQGSMTHIRAADERAAADVLWSQQMLLGVSGSSSGMMGMTNPTGAASNGAYGMCAKASSFTPVTGLGDARCGSGSANCGAFFEKESLRAVRPRA